jgi:predicted acyl esterase
MGRTVIGGDVLFERDIAVPMRDGTRLRANVFRPAGERRVPALMSVTPYGKDKLPDRLGMFFMRLAGIRFGTRLELSVQGRDAAKYLAFKHAATVNRGAHTIRCGGRFDSHLLLPVTRGEIVPAP